MINGSLWSCSRKSYSELAAGRIHSVEAISKGDTNCTAQYKNNKLLSMINI